MGVTGLWKLIESSGKPVPLETLEGKVLAIDISIWLHQVVKGYQDGRGNQVANAHLLGLFNRICKLLYFRIKPIFVFDGSVPQLKLRTIAKRAQGKMKMQSEAERLEQLLLENLAKEKIVIQALGDPEKILSPLKTNKTKPVAGESRDELFKLPPTAEQEENFTDEDEECPKQNYDFNIHKIDIKSSYFKSLPAEMRHDILTDLKETRKQNSWGRIRELPVDSDDFSDYQMKRLLKRRQVQVGIEEAEKEMGGQSWSLSDLENLLTEDGLLKMEDEKLKKYGQRIASNENVRFIMVRDIAKAIETAKAKEESDKKLNSIMPKADDEEDLDLQRAIQLSLMSEGDQGEIETEFDPNAKMQLNRNQRQKFSSTIQQPHGLVRGFMMEYGEMNTEDLNDLMESTQATFTDASQIITIADEDENFETPTENSVKNSPEKANKNIEIVVKPSLDNSGDDLFADIFDNQIDETSNNVPDVEVASISSDDTEPYDVPSQSNLIESEIIQESATVGEAIKDNVCPIEDLSIEDEDDLVEVFEDKTVQTEIVHESKSSNRKDIGITENKSTVEDVVEIHSDPIETENVEKVETSPVHELKNTQNSFKSPIETKDEMKLTDQDFMIDQPQPSCSTAVSKPHAMLQTPEKKQTVKMEDVAKGLEEMHNQLKEQQISLDKEKNKLERMGTSITKSMADDCKHLLKMFGIPFIESPMEAEAQCAFLNLIDLTDGTITDDSDIWLFGGKTIYKNFFVQKKVVMEFRQENIEEKFHLDRKKLIQLAMLVGSDYTMGVNGIGAVTALEILAAFPPTPEESNSTDHYQSLVSSLRKFREWILSGKSSGTLGKTALRSKLKNIELAENFPSLDVARAYLEPTVDTSSENFTWGAPDKETLIDYARTKLGWTRIKTEELLNPVLKKLSEKKQSTIKDYFKMQMSKKFNGTEKLSKRVQKAIDKMENKGSDEKQESPDEEVKPKRLRGKPGKRKLPKATKSESNESDKIIILSDEEDKPTTSKTSLQQSASSSKSEDSSSLQSSKKSTKVAAKRKNQEESTSGEGTSASSASPPKNRKIRIPETKQVIPQKEKDRVEQDLAKQKAIEIFKKSSKKNNGK